MHKFFIGSKKTIAAMMAVLMFTSSTGGYAQAGMIEDAFSQNAQTEASAETVSDPRQPVVVTTPEAEPAVTEPEVSPEVTQEPEENKDASKETTVDSQPSADTSDNSGQEEQEKAPDQKTEEVSAKPGSSDTEKSDTERSDKSDADQSDAGKESEDLSNTVTRFIQEKDSYAYMEKITNMDELLMEMDEEQLYELLYFMRLSFLSEVPENHSQTLDTYYEILEAYLKAKTEEPKQEWQDLVLPYLPSYEEGMESTEDYLEAVDGKDFDLLSLEDQMASLESCTDWEKLPAQEKTVTIEAAMQSVRQDIKDGKANDAVWTMYHYGYFSEVLMELDAESLDAFFQGLDDENRFVFHKLTGYAYFQFVDQGYALDGYSDQAEILRYFYQDAEETDKADEILLAYINKKNDTTFASVADYEADLTKDSSENFGEVMEAWNLYLEGRLDSLVKKAEKEEIRETPIEKKNPQEPAVPDDPEIPDGSENTGDDDQATMPGGADIGEKDTLADIAYPAPDKDLKSGISTYTVPTSSGYWVTAGKSWIFVSNGQTVKGDWIYDGVHWYYARSSDGYLIVSSHAVVDNRAYYFNASGEMLTNQTNIQLGNYKYNINGSGYIQSGWIPDSWITGRWFYVENYATIYGWKQIGNSVADAGGDTNPYYFFGSSTNRAMYWNGYQEISGVDYYFDDGGHWIAAKIGDNKYYRLVTANTGAIDKAWSGCTIKILGGNHENTTMHKITNKNLTITSDGTHRVYIKNNENSHSNRNSVFYVSGGSLTVNGYISFDGGQYDDYSKNTENNGSDVLTSGSGGNITVDSANVKIYRCSAGVHAAYTSNKAGTITVNKAEIYHCQFGIGTYGSINVDGANIHDNVQNIHMNCFYQNNTMNVKNAKIHDATLGAVGFIPAWANMVRRTAIMNISDTEVYNNRSGLILSENLADNSSLNVNSGVNVHNNTYGVLAHSYGTVNIGKNAAVTPKIVNNTSHGILCDSKTPSGVSIVIDKATITGNGNTSENGGGVLTTASVSTSSNTNISSNKGAYGGGIYGESTCTITVNGGTFNNNSANGSGGAICSQGTLNLNSGTLKSNTATSDGGAIWFKHGTIKGNIESNTAGNLGGGVSHSGDSTAAYVSGGTINSNKAKSGGGLYTDGTLEITGGTFNNNTSTGNAGGIMNNGTITMTGGSITNNYSGWDGGGINSHGNFNFNGGTIQNNTAYWLGGNIHVQAVSETNGGKSVFTVNSTTPISGGKAENAAGGGVCVYAGAAKLVLNNGAVVTNNTGPTGGGIDSNGVIEINGATISENTATAANGNGGGIQLFADANGVGSLKMTSGTIKDNKATAEGGGIWGENVTISGGTISGNTAGTAGGGVLLNGTGACTMSGGTIKENTSTYSGGGVFVDDNTPFTMTGGTISDNKAGGNGGGIYMDNAANVTISDGSVTGNTTEQRGGGVFLASDGTFSLTGGSISSNISKHDGAGILCDNGTINMSGGFITRNNTNSYGGGVCLAGEEANLNLSGNAVISSNSADTGGGGVFSDGSQITMTGGAIVSNYADEGAGVFIGIGTLTMSDGDVSDNEADRNGGGLYIMAEAVASISGGDVTGNIAHDGDGAGIYLEDADLTMTGGTVNDNLTGSGIARGIYYSDYGTLKLARDILITDDIFLCDKSIINVIGDLKDADLNISMNESGTYKQRVIAEYSADTTSYKNGTKDTARYSLETNTNGYAKKKGIKISDTGTKGQTYQVWLDGNMLPIRVNYIGRYATQGSVKSEIVQPDVAEYTVRKNDGYTGYQRKDYSFQGWTIRTKTTKPTYSEKNLNTISYDELLSIYETQQEEGITGDMFKTQASEDTKRSVAGIALAAAKNALSGLVLPVQVQAAEEEQVLDVYMLDTWDKYPVINWKENTFYEGTDVTKTDLLANIRLSDEEDGVIDTSKLVINSITYSAGKLENGQKSASYTVNYPGGMKDTDKLDTWFMQLDKNDSPVTHILHCSVTDSVGNVTKADITVKVKYNEFPTITAQDRYFTLEEAQSGAITKDALLQDAIRDYKLSANDTEDGNLNDKLELVDFKADDFTSFTDSGYVTVTFHVQDSMGPDGKGKETYRQIKVYVVKDGVIEEPEKAQNVRFINQKYYDLNKDVDPDTLSEEEKEVRNSNGGLNVESKWYHDANYRALIEETFGKTEGTVYEFSKEDIDKIKAYVDANGLGLAESEGAQDAFYSQFIAPARK